jgi:hypothetical protein
VDEELIGYLLLFEFKGKASTYNIYAKQPAGQTMGDLVHLSR